MMDTSENKNEIVVYQADNFTRVEVKLGNDTVWLNRNQIAALFNRDVKTIGKHINNVFTEAELDRGATVANFAIVQIEGDRKIERQIEHYNLDVIISVGYRVKSKQGTQFRIWANKVLKDYLLKGYAVNQRFERIEKDVNYLKNKVDEFDFQIRTSLPEFFRLKKME
ncbi:MAG: virulence RhuM family protein [Bacteroidales bacterium]|nr:virulence RhuM family protein [Bacteroidales bacterium]